MNLFTNNLTKIAGAVTTVQGVLLTMIAGGTFDGLMSVAAIRWLGIFVTLTGALITGLGFNNSTKEKVAQAMETAIKAELPKELQP